VHLDTKVPAQLSGVVSRDNGAIETQSASLSKPFFDPANSAYLARKPDLAQHN